jgi:hypothetical protein
MTIKFVLIVMLLIPPALIAQENSIKPFDELILDERTGLIELTSVIQVDKYNRDEIFYRTVKWFNDDFQKNNLVISVKDSSEGFIEGRYLNSYGYRKNEKMNYYVICGNIKINVKDSKLKITINKFKLIDYQYTALEDVVLEEDRSFKKKYRTLNDQITSKTLVLFEDLQFYIINYDDSKKEADW